jgi:hypothetical protein
MDGKTRPLEVYTRVNVNNVGSEKDYTLKEEIENDQQWGNESIVTKLVHIIKIIQHLTFD